MTLRLFIPADAGALAVGAEEVATALRAAGARRNVAVDIVRTGSRGLYWLEPMVEAANAGGPDGLWAGRAGRRRKPARRRSSPTAQHGLVTG